MAVELEVTFRGMFVLAMPPVGPRDHARILMPRNDTPRVAKGNERYTIPPYESYVAIPMSANPSPEPDFIADLQVEHGGTFNGEAAASENAPELEAVSRTLRRKRVLEEQPKERYGVYYANGCEIFMDPLRGATNELLYDSTPVGDTQQPMPGERSVNWLAPMRAGTDSATVAAALLANIPPATSSYIDLSKGIMRPRGLLRVHRWRYLHASNDTFLRPIAQELLVTSQTDETVTITLRALGDGDTKAITFEPVRGDRIIIGCEPLDDILGNAAVQSCVEPAYDFELQYDLIGGSRLTSPVPLCAVQNSDHRSPPGAACGPPVTTGP